MSPSLSEGIRVALINIVQAMPPLLYQLESQPTCKTQRYSSVRCNELILFKQRVLLHLMHNVVDRRYITTHNLHIIGELVYRIICCSRNKGMH
mmetsp:Transcript_18596/g.40262  ORF Transcript_18596/g.40262 Transcript_18596/m.40262 type:complete len:93 (+) Transcript_18596:99-377(+)